jgi:uncharacterized protein YecE (DUF72 family)
VPRQPSLLPEADERPLGERRATDTAPDALQARFVRLREVAAALPSNVRFGTSSWSFPGWEGLVFSKKRTTTWLAREGLREYARHPLLSTVGVDRSYYAPIPDEDFERYAEQLPDGFPCCCKAPGLVTSPILDRHGPRSTSANRALSERSESKGARPNPDFLSADRFVRDLIDPVSRRFRDHAGPFVLQFPPMLRRSGLAPAAFVDGLDRFLGHLPHEFQYAVEVRDRALLSEDYVRVLEAHGVAHVYNAWTAMPLPGEQAAVVPVDRMPFVMVRLLLRPGATYEQQREAFAPFDRIPEPQEEMRGQVVDLVARAVARAVPVYVLVNNKAEGSSPLTIEGLARRLMAHGSRAPRRAPEP